VARRLPGEGDQILQIPGVGQGIEIDQAFLVLCQPIQDKITADKASATGHQYQCISPRAARAT